jgi:hypothetical protein
MQTTEPDLKSGHPNAPTKMFGMNWNLRVIGALAVLGMLALAASCRGFFVDPTLTQISISPAAPQVQVGQSEGLSVYGTYNDGSTGQVTTGVTWSSSDSTVATFSSPTSNVLQGVAPGTATITANAQAVSATATATVFITITQMTIAPTSATVTAGQVFDGFTVSGISNGQKVILTPSSTLTAYLNGTAATDVTCSYNSATQKQDCTTQSTSSGPYQIVASYAGSTITATATLTVSP